MGLARVGGVDAGRRAEREQLCEQRHIGGVLRAGEPFIEAFRISGLIFWRIGRRARSAHEIAHGAARDLGHQ